MEDLVPLRSTPIRMSPVADMDLTTTNDQQTEYSLVNGNKPSKWPLLIRNFEGVPRKSVTNALKYLRKVYVLLWLNICNEIINSLNKIWTSPFSKKIKWLSFAHQWKNLFLIVQSFVSAFIFLAVKKRSTRVVLINGIND